MVKHFTTFLLAVSFSICLKAQFYTQYFDGADTSIYSSVFIQMDTTAGNIWQVGPPSKPIFNQAASVPNVLITDTAQPYPINNFSRFQFFADSGTFVTWGIVAVHWKQKLDMDANFDGGIIEFSMDSGMVWHNAFNHPAVYNFFGFNPANVDTLPSGAVAFSGQDSSWQDVWLCFDRNYITAQQNGQFIPLLMRYTFVSDSIDNQREGWMIDNMLVGPTIIHTIAEEEQSKYMRIFPSQTNGEVNIEVQKLAEYHIIQEIQLLDMSGKLLQKWGNRPTKTRIDIGGHKAGTYYLNIRTNKKSESFPIILTH